MNTRLMGVLGAYVMRPELTSTPLRVPGPALDGPSFELPDGRDGWHVYGQPGSQRASIKASSQNGRPAGPADAPATRPTSGDAQVGLTRNEPVGPANEPTGPAAELQPAGHAFQPLDDDRFSAACATCGRNREDSIHDTAAAADGGALTGPAATRRFVLGGRAIFTLVGRAGRYTFKVSKVEPKPDSPYASRGDTYFVNLLTGPDNTVDYTYVGVLQLATGTIKLTAKSKYRADSAPVAGFNWVMSRVWAGRSFEPAQVLHCGRCARCGRVLTVPESITSGFGPECLAKLEGGE